MKASVVFALGALTLTAQPAWAASADPVCTARTADCLRATAQLVIDAYLAHDGARVPLTPDAKRTENGGLNANGEAEVRDAFARATMIKAIRDVRYLVDTDKGEVAVFFLVDIRLSPEQAGGTVRAGKSRYHATIKSKPGDYTLHEAARLKIVDGRISEAEYIDYVQPGMGAKAYW